MKSIKTKILLVVVFALLVITLVVSMIAVDMTHEIMHADADRLLNNVALREANSINAVLDDVTKSVAIMEHYACNEIESVGQLTDPELREEYIQSTKQMFTEIALNTKGIAGFYLRLNPKVTTSTSGYYNLVEDGTTIKEMQVTDLNKYTEEDEQNTSWYYTPIREGKATWLDPYYFPGQDALLITYAVPVYIDSELLGVIGFDMDFDYLLKRISEITVYEKGYAVLLATDGETRYNNQDKEMGTDPHARSVEELQNGMKLELLASYKDIQRNIRPMMHKIVAAFLVVLLLAIFYTVFMTNQIVKPLKQLMVAAKKIADGEEYTPVVATTKDEIGTLSEVLTSTYAKIQEYTAYINALAYRDSLTGVKNSTAYTEATAKLNKEINCGNPQFGVLVVDINNLKRTNDRYGHNIGDELIIHTAKILRDTFKSSTVYRIGGDEFAVILTGKDYDNYTGILERIDEACAKDYIGVNEDKIPVSLARGVATFDPSIDAVYKDVFKKADRAMYMHKELSKAAAL